MNRRYNFFLVTTIIFIFFWAFHLFIVQVNDPHNLNGQVALRQNPSKKILYPKRGNILTSKRELLVGSLVHYQLDIDLKSVKNHAKRNNKNYNTICDSIAIIISKNTSLSNSAILKKLHSKANSIFIDNDISEGELITIKKEFKNLSIPGLIINFSKIDRTYPKDKLAARLLGMTGSPSKRKIDNNSEESLYMLEGKCGLEHSFNKELTGSYGWQQTIRDANNKRIPIVTLKEKSAVNGYDVVLTMNIEIQEILEENLRIGIQEYKAKNAIGIIMEPNSGNIIAISGITNSDKNSSSSKLRSQANLAVSFMFEPGSVMKPITALLALEDKVFDPNELISTENYIIKYSGDKNRTITDDHKFKALNLQDIIAHSSNVGISKAVEKIGSKKLYERMLALGFGQTTSSNINNEASGIFRKLKDWQGYSLHSISFGQEISVTALQLAGAYCALANGGDVMRPNILKEIIDSDNKEIKKNKPQKLRTISDKKSLDTLKEYLQSVVDYGTARGSKLSFVDMAGKTGTAEKKVLGEAGYSKEKYTSVFAGFFPVKTPKYVIVIVFDEPDYNSYSYYASNSAAPTFSKIVKQIVKLPDSNILTDIIEDKTNYITAYNFMGSTRAEVNEAIKNKEILCKFHGDENENTVINQFPKPGILYDKNEQLVIVFGNNKNSDELSQELDFQMPSIIGKTIRQAMNETNKRGIKLIVEGNGRIISQSIAPETQIKFGEKCRIKAR